VYTRKDSLPDLTCFGKGLNALGKGFAECHPRHTSQGNQILSKAEFAECFLSAERALGKKKKVTETAN